MLTNMTHDRHHIIPIDGLRAVAVVAVIVHHFHDALLPGGYLGVDLFFVISGFVIARSVLERERPKSLLSAISGFYARRIRRLVPALLLFVLTNAFLICLFDPSPIVTVKTGMAALAGFSNWYLLSQSIDYFAPATDLNIFAHTWSLAVEEQFYLAFPVIVWLTRGIKRRRLFTTIFALVGLLSLALFVKGAATNQSWVHFASPPRFWEIAAGCLLAVAPTKAHARYGEVAFLVLLASLFAPLDWRLLAAPSVVVCAVLLLRQSRTEGLVNKLLSVPPAVFLGRISYSLYLWHWGVLCLSKWTIGVFWWTVPFQIIAMLAAATASYQWIETPLRTRQWSKSDVITIGHGVAMSVAAAIALFVLYKTPELYTGRPPRLEGVGVPSMMRPYSPAAAFAPWRGRPCVLTTNADVGQKVAVDDCTIGDFEKADHRVLVVGNSFSAAFPQAFDDLVLQDNHAVTLTSSWGASPVAEVPNEGEWTAANAYYWQDIVPSLVARLRAGDWVFLISDLAFLSPPGPSGLAAKNLGHYKRGLKDLSLSLRRRGVRLAVLHGLPFARDAHCQPVSATPQWFAPFGSPCRMPNKQASLIRRSALDGVLRDLSASGDVRLIDVFHLFCPRDECTYFAANGDLLYRDEYSHPSIEAARLVAPLFRQALSKPNTPVELGLQHVPGPPGGVRDGPLNP